MTDALGGTPTATGRSSRARRAIASFAVVTLLLAAAIGLGYGVEAVVTVPTQEVAAVARVPRIDLEPQRATRVATGEATGTAGATKATGRVTIEYLDKVSVLGCHERRDCPPPELDLPAGTRMATCADELARPCPRFDVFFATLAPVRIRTSSQVDVGVEAVEPGPRGNVRQGRIRELVDPPKPEHAELRVLFSTEMTGGSEGRTAVAQADIDRVRAAFEPEVRRQAETLVFDLARRKKVADTPPDVTVTVEADPPAGAHGSSVRVTLTAVAVAAGYDESELQDQADRALAGARPPGMFVVPGSVALAAPRPLGNEVAADVRAHVSTVDPEALRRTVARRWTRDARHDVEGRARIEGRPFVLPFTPLRRAQVSLRWTASTVR